MGKWVEVETLYGPREQWLPEAPGDWPETEVGAVALIPDPCPRCGGRVRRWVTAHGGLPDHVWARMMREWETAGRPEPVPVRPSAEYRRCYSFDHYRDCMGASTPLPDLHPPRRV